jgi:hypothetical protein
MQLVVFLLVWLAGQVLLYFYLKNQNHALTFKDVVHSFIISALIGVVFSYAAYKANLVFWLVYVAIAGFSAYITYKLIEKSNVGSVQKLMRSGSMAEAEAKSELTFTIVAGVALLLVLLCFTTFDTYAHAAFVRAPFIANLLGVIVYLGGVGMLYYAKFLSFPAKTAIGYALGILALLVLGLSLACGFNFDLHGIDDVVK